MLNSIAWKGANICSGVHGGDMLAGLLNLPYLAQKASWGPTLEGQKAQPQ